MFPVTAQSLRAQSSHRKRKEKELTQFKESEDEECTQSNLVQVKTTRITEEPLKSQSNQESRIKIGKKVYHVSLTFKRKILVLTLIISFLYLLRTYEY